MVDDNRQLATPISLADSYDDATENTSVTGSSPISTDQESSYKSQICRLLSVNNNDRDTEDLANEHPLDGGSFDYIAAEEDLSVWGYMISTQSESSSFLLSKESRCGKKNATLSSERDKHFSKEGGVVLKDYNGDNLASSGYLIGEAEECDVVIRHSDVCDRHCVIFKIQRADDGEDSVLRYCVYLQDISGEGTYVNDEVVRRNEVRLVNDGDIISLSRNGPSWTYKMTHNTSCQTFEHKFRIGKTLGKGHFAEVFEIFERTTGQRYAAKMIKKRLDNDKGMFLNEIGLLMSCTHPLITCIRDVFDQTNVIYLVLELAAGGELFDRIIQQGKFSEADTRHIFKQVFSALQYLHSRSIVHRDIKPENILLTSAGGLDIRIADFGLAKIIGSSTATSTLAGTPSYIPPEMLSASQNTKQVMAYTNKVDSWSAGVVLYICLCGFPPFSSELAPPPMKQQIREGRYQFTRPYWDSISDSAIDLVQRLLTVDVESRYSVKDALQHPWMTESLPISAEQPFMEKRGLKRQRTMIKELGRPHKQ